MVFLHASGSQSWPYVNSLGGPFFTHSQTPSQEILAQLSETGLIQKQGRLDAWS